MARVLVGVKRVIDYAVKVSHLITRGEHNLDGQRTVLTGLIFDDFRSASSQIKQV